MNGLFSGDPLEAALRRTVVGIACVAGIACIGVLDYLTGPEVGLSAFYLLPIGVAAWLGGRRAGLAASVCAAAVWLAADLAPNHYSHPAIAYWNASARLIMFSVVSLLVSHVRGLTDSLKEKVAEETAALAAEVGKHRLTRDALRDTEQQFRILVESVQDFAVFMLDAEGNISSWNKGAQALTGYRAEQVLNRHFSCLWLPEDVRRGGAYEALAIARREGAVEGEGWRRRSDGSRFWAATMITALRDETGRLQGFSKSMSDITLRRRLENGLLSKEESESRRIGQDLHDVLGQDLTALALLSKELEESLSTGHLPEAQIAERMTRCANQAVERARSLARGLCPLKMEAGGLATSLAELALATEDVFGVRCRFECRGLPPDQSATVNLHLYRIAQEAITNAVKHGKARQILVILSSEGQRCTLRIEDDGAESPEEGRGEPGMGISMMRYRARAMGGYLAIERLSPVGTAVVCSLPAVYWEQDKGRERPPPSKPKKHLHAIQDED